MEEDDERAVELSAIAAIFPELVIDEKDPYHATLDILVTPEKPLKIYFQSSHSSYEEHTTRWLICLHD